MRTIYAPVVTEWDEHLAPQVLFEYEADAKRYAKELGEHFRVEPYVLMDRQVVKIPVYGVEIRMLPEDKWEQTETTDEAYEYLIPEEPVVHVLPGWRMVDGKRINTKRIHAMGRDENEVNELAWAEYQKVKNNDPA